MKEKLLLIFAFVSLAASGQSVLGKWRTIDDESGKAVSVVEIFENHGKIYGRVVELLNPRDRNKTCVNCPGEDHNKPILGLLVIKGLRKSGSDYDDGKILDPKHGKLYKCTISPEGADKLKVRGYIGVSLIGRTQYWHRVKS